MTDDQKKALIELRNSCKSRADNCARYMAEVGQSDHRAARIAYWRRAVDALDTVLKEKSVLCVIGGKNEKDED